MTATSGRARGLRGPAPRRRVLLRRRGHHAGNFPAGAGRGGGLAVPGAPRPPRRTPTCTGHPSRRPGPARSPRPPRAAAAGAAAGARRAARRAPVPAERPASRVAWSSRRLALRSRAWDTVAPQQRSRSCNGSWREKGERELEPGGSAMRRRSVAVPKASCDLGRPAPVPPPAHVTSSFRCSPPRPGSHEHRTRAGQEVLRAGHKRQVPTRGLTTPGFAHARRGVTPPSQTSVSPSSTLVASALERFLTLSSSTVRWPRWS